MHLHRHLWANSPTAEALRIVRQVIHGSQKPLTVREVYKLALQEPSSATGKSPLKHAQSTRQTVEVDGPLPPHESHAIRSMSYLKHVVLPVLARKKEVEKVHSQHTLSAEEIEARLKGVSKAARKTTHLHTTQDIWVWRPKAPTQPPKPQPVAEVIGKEVGVGEDWSHLNKRRQRAREQSVKRDVQWLLELEKARQQAAAEASTSS